MNANEEVFPVEVFDGTQWQAMLVKSLLDNAEIEAFVKDQRMGILEPWVADGGGAGPIKIFVSSLDYERAKEVISQYEQAEKSEE
jgi:hypothetical protein